ncbi:MAG: YlzJ-like family protein [Ruminiclostridium sp.]|nr:YlzJ-like family protein [Ruminiclostridium sp.]
MIYSVVPYEHIFYNAEENPSLRMEVSLHGEQVVLLKNSDSTYTIERLLSTNPKSYLKPELLPGTLLMTVASVKEAPGVTWEILNKD